MSIVTILAVIAATIAALTVIGKALFSIYRFVRKIDDTNDIIQELPAWQTKVNLAIKELHPNSGSSLKDQVTAINQKACEMDEKVDTLNNNLDELREIMQTHVADDHLHGG